MIIQSQQFKFQNENSTIFSDDYLKEIKNGSATDQLMVGKAYFHAYHIEDNCETVFEWIRLSAEQGSMEAQFWLANLYALGQGTPKSHTDSYKWYTKSAIQGYKKALIRIHNLYQEDIRIRSSGQLNSEEENWNRIKFRELKESRLDQQKMVLNGAIEYYTNQFNRYKELDQDDPDVQQNLGFLYEHGYGVKKYEKWAIKFYAKAAEQGYGDAQYNLGRLYQKNTCIKFNYRKAFHWLVLSAQGGNISAQCDLAYFYEKGLSTEIDYQESLYWYTKAADAGHSEAQIILGKWYRKGQYVDQDYTEAYKWYKLAAEGGNKVAKNCIDQLYQNNILISIAGEGKIPKYSSDQSRENRLCSKLRLDITQFNNTAIIKQLEKLAHNALKGDGNAMYEIGLKYLNGEYFVKNLDISIKWIHNAANRNHKEAQLKLAELYKVGDTVKQDYYRASKWTKKLAKTKNDTARCNLGILYKEGLGVRKDPLEASKWFTMSSDQGNCDAQYHIGSLRYIGTGLSKNHDEALELFTSSARKQNIKACLELGKFYLNGYLVQKDIKKAIRLFKYAANHGDVDSQYELAELYENGSHVERDFSKADIYYSMVSNSNNAKLICKIAISFLDIEETKCDYAKIFTLLKRAAELGDTTAGEIFQTPMAYVSTKDEISHIIDTFIFVSKRNISEIKYNIGHIYEHGYTDRYGKTYFKNYSKAFTWYSSAARSGDTRAQVRLGILYEEGKGVKKDLVKATKYYTSAYNTRNSDAIYRLACMYLTGCGVSQDFLKAFQLYTESANLGNIESSRCLLFQDSTEASNPETHSDIYNDNDKDGSSKSEDDGDSSDIFSDSDSDYSFDSDTGTQDNKYNETLKQSIFENNIKMLEKVAEMGYVATQYYLGTIFENKNDSQSVKWLILASKGGITDAHFRLGVHYEEGRGTEIDYSKAKKLYEASADNEHEEAIYRLASLYLYGKGTRVDYKKAYGLYSKAAEMGHSLSRKVLNISPISNEKYLKDVFITDSGWNNEDILFDVESDEFQQSLLMCRNVATEGNVELQYELGLHYETLPKDPNYLEAIKWYTMATENSHRDSYYHLGLIHEKGLGIPQNHQKAKEFYEKAYNQGCYNALYRLGILYQHSRDLDRDSEKAIQFYTEAADHGHLESQHTLGKLYEKSELVRYNPMKTLEWYTKAYTQGYDPVTLDLYSMYDHVLYENFFYDKLHRILLSVSESRLLENHNGYYGIYGSIYYRLGHGYFLGIFGPKNYKQAYNYFKISSEKFGNTDSANFISLKYDPSRSNFVEILEMYDVSIEDVNNDNLYSLSSIYLKETTDDINDPALYQIHGDDNDAKIRYSKGIKYLEKAADRGHRKSQLQLIELYQHGVTKNIKGVIKWYSISSDSDSRLYAFTIATLYHFDDDFRDYTKALWWYKKVEGTNRAIAYNNIGILYHNDNGTDENYTKAYKYWTESARLGNESAMYNLGDLFYYGKGVLKNLKKAYDFFIEAALKKHPDAYKMLTVMLPYEEGADEDTGWNIKTLDNICICEYDIARNYHYKSSYCDHKKAIEWYKKAEGSNKAHALYNIGILYLEGEGVKRNFEQAIQYFQKSSDLGNEFATYNLGELYYNGIEVVQNYRKAYDFFIKAADKEHRKACEMLATMYKNGEHVDKNRDKSIEWYIKGSDKNSDIKLYDIAQIYHPQNDYIGHEKALKLYEKITGSRKSDALYNKGISYMEGDNVTQNYKLAIQYLEHSIIYGNTRAYFKLGEIYYYGQSVEINYKTALHFFNKGISKNHTESFTMLGKMYKSGHGVDKDVKKAIELYNKAVDGGSDHAALLLGELYHSTGEFQDFSKALEYYQKVGIDSNFSSDASRGIGLLFEYGDGVKQNYKESILYYSQSAIQGNKGAMYNLALMYYYGRGIAQNFKLGYYYMKRVFSYEKPSKRKYIFVEDEIISTETQVSLVYSEITETALYGESYYQLGIISKYVQGEPINNTEAIYYLSEAIKYGNNKAPNELT